MPQNWWELFPEVIPSPFARRRPLPLYGPGAFMPASATMPRAAAPYAAPGLDAGPPRAFDPFAFPGGEPAPGELPDEAGGATPAGYGQQPFAVEDAGSTMDRDTAIQHAAAAIQRGADPNAVRDRLQTMGHINVDPQSPFEDLIPDDHQATRALTGPAALPGQPRMSAPEPSGLEANALPAGLPEDRLRSVERRSDPRLAPQKGDDLRKDYQPKIGGPLEDRARAIGRAIVDQVADNPMRRGEIKSDRPMPRSDVHAAFSSPFRGGPRNAVPRRSYGVGPYHLGGGLNGNGYVPREGDAQLMARAIYSEGRNTPQDMLALGWAIVNRVGFRNNRRLAFGSTLNDVVYQRRRDGRYQYSFLDDGGSAAWRESANPSSLTGPNRAAWLRAASIANAILSNRTRDPSGGAHYFFASSRYQPGVSSTAPSDFPVMLNEHHYDPTAYESGSTYREGGRLRRNYFFRENPEKLWAPPRDRGGRH